MTLASEDQRLRAARPARPHVDAWQPIGVSADFERGRSGLRRFLTVFLAGAECPFTCVFCDLYRFTTEKATPVGALPAQLRVALDRSRGLDWQELARGLELRTGAVADSTAPLDVKLYNASNFFDSRAVPVDDLPELAALVSGFDRVVVECHPRLVDRRVVDFAGAIDGRLEVAIGLETVHEQTLARLNKRSTLRDFDRAAERLARWQIDLRAFVLVGVPYLAVEKQLECTLRSVEHALDRGARVVSLIPVRGGNGELERLQAEGRWRPPDLRLLEACLRRAVQDARGVVQVDTWDLERLVCEPDDPARARRLERWSLLGSIGGTSSAREAGA